MPDNVNPASPQPPGNAKAASPSTAHDAGHVPITEEFDSPKWTLPPIVPVVIALVVIGIVVAIVAYTNRPMPSASGNITKVLASDQDGNSLVAIHLNFRNALDKPLWIREINSEVQTSDGKTYKDTAAPAVDVERYLQAAPELAAEKIDPLKAETKIPVQGSLAGMVVFVYPVSKTVFDGRKTLTVRVEFYDHTPMILKQ